MFEYFENGDSVYESFKYSLVTQAMDVCRKSINQRFLELVFRDFEFGWLHVTERATIGRQRRSRRKEYQVHGFILCRYSNKHIFIELVCCKSMTNEGKRLIETVENHARNNAHDTTFIFVHGAIESMVGCYLKLGYDKGGMVQGKDDVSYIMTKEIIHDTTDTTAETTTTGSYE